MNNDPGADPGRGDRPPKTCKSNFTHHDVYNSKNSICDIRLFLPSIDLSQQWCEVHFIYITVVSP